MPDRNFIYSQLFVKLPVQTKSFTGQTVIVTGSNVGLGYEAAKSIASLNAARIIIAVRDVKKGEAARQNLIESLGSQLKTPKAAIEVWQLDLADYSSVIAFAERAQKLDRIDVLLENAGIATNDWRIASGGEELTITVNVISTFLLAFMLMPKLRATGKAHPESPTPRLVIVSSEVHAFTSMSPDKDAPYGEILNHLNDKEKTKFSDRYQVSKLLEIFTVRELVHHLDWNDPVVINLLNPGLCNSELNREGNPLVSAMKFVLARSAEVGARNLVWAASAGKETHGQYCGDCQVDSPSGFVTSRQGTVLQRRVYDEVLGRLEKIRPGVTKTAFT